MLSTSGEFPENEPFLQLVQNGSLLDAWADIDVWHVRGNVGFISILLDNPHYKTRYFDDGLRPCDAYGCALNYLFAPSTEMKRYFAHEVKVMSSNWLIVGVQIRLGDSSFAGEDPSTEVLYNLKHFFECAEYLIDKHRQLHQNATMFLISDSLNVRKQAKHVYGEQLMTKVDQPGHVGKGAPQRQAMIQAAGEHWLFGMANFHIISSRGSFGRSGALRSRQWHSVYSMDVDSDGGELCGGKPWDFDKLARRPPWT